MKRAILLCAYVSLTHTAAQNNELDIFFEHIRFSKIEQIKPILKKHPEWLETKNKSGRTPLLIATILGRKETIIFLLDLGANIHERDHLGYSAFHFAMEHAHTRSLCEVLIERGADPTYCCSEKTPLMAAVKNNKYKLTQLLLQTGAPGSLIMREGQCALTYAAHNNLCKIAELLIEHGASYDGIAPHDGYLTSQMQEILHDTTGKSSIILRENPLHYLRNREDGKQR